MVRVERTIEVTLISATDLKKVKKFGREQKNYVSAYIYPVRRQATPADPYGGVNPIWNSTLKLTCYESDLYPAATSSGEPGASSSSVHSAHEMTLEVYSHSGGIFHTPDKLVGTVTVPLQQVVSVAKAGGAMPACAVHLPSDSGEVQGTLNLSVKLGASRELGEYEDLNAAPLSSYSDQGAPSLMYPPASDEGPGKQRSSYKTQGQSSYGNYPPASDYTPSVPNQNTFGSEEDIVTGYPAAGSSYAFAPLGQLPMQRQEQLGPQSGGHGPYVVISSSEGTHHPTRLNRRWERKEKKAERRDEKHARKSERRDEKYARKSERRREKRDRKSGVVGHPRHIGARAVVMMVVGLLAMGH